MDKNKFFVIAVDRFMSGWGPAEGKRNILVIECDSLQEAKIVEDNANNRSDMDEVRIVTTYPHHVEGLDTYVQNKTKSDMPAWFIKGYFEEAL